MWKLKLTTMRMTFVGDKTGGMGRLYTSELNDGARTTRAAASKSPRFRGGILYYP